MQAPGYSPLILPTGKRPAGVTWIAIYHFAGCIALVLLSLLGFLCAAGATQGMFNSEYTRGMNTSIAVIGAIWGIAFLAAALVPLMVGVGLLRLRKWARLVAIILAIVRLAGSGSSLPFLLLHPHPLSLFSVGMLAMDIWIVYYLLRPDVRMEFGA
jgi:hypothetical protein